MKSYLFNILCQFKWYRKRIGGKWYKISDIDSAGGIAGSIIYWTQQKVHDDVYVIAIEEWPESK